MTGYITRILLGVFMDDTYKAGLFHIRCNGRLFHIHCYTPTKMAPACPLGFNRFRELVIRLQNLGVSFRKRLVTTPPSLVFPSVPLIFDSCVTKWAMLITAYTVSIESKL